MRRIDCVILGFLFAVTMAVYAPVARFDFVYFDDPDYVFQNSRVLEGLTVGNFVWAFKSLEVGNWHPLTWLSHMLDVQIFGARAGPMHLVNAAIHAANACLVFLLLRLMTGATWRCALVAAIFALHPLRVQSVAWIAERKDVLSTLFGLLAMLAYVRYARDRSIGSYLVVLLAFALSLLSKPMLVTLPFVLLLLDYWPLKRFATTHAARLIVEKLPLLGLSIACSIMTVIAQRRGGAVIELMRLPLEFRLGNAVTSYINYIIDMLWPTRLSLLYLFPVVQSVWVVLGATTLLVGITVFVMVMSRRLPHLPVGWFWYLGTLAPVIGIVTVGQQARADRYTYFPQIGLLIMMVWSVAPARRRLTMAAQAVGAGVVLGLLIALTSLQLRHWRNTQTLARHTIAVCGPLPSVHLLWGVALAAEQKHDEALAQFEQALRLRPNYVPALLHAANSLALQNRFDQAIPLARRAVQLDPGNALAHYNLGIMLLSTNDPVQSRQSLRRAIELRPDFEQAHRALQQAGPQPDGAR